MVLDQEGQIRHKYIVIDQYKNVYSLSFLRNVETTTLIISKPPYTTIYIAKLKNSKICVGSAKP